MEIMLDHAVAAAEGAEILRGALLNAPLIKQRPAPDVRIQSIETEGVRYAMRYWLERFDHEIDARDAIWREVDTGLRRAGASAPIRRIHVFGDPSADLPPETAKVRVLGIGTDLPGHGSEPERPRVRATT
jgi:small-conductance mechanosensitive channel